MVTTGLVRYRRRPADAAALVAAARRTAIQLAGEWLIAFPVVPGRYAAFTSASGDFGDPSYRFVRIA